MPDWYEVFDNEEIQLLTRKQVAKLSVALVVALSLTVGLILYSLAHPSYVYVNGFSFAAIWLLPAAWLLHKRNRLKRIVWCIKVSSQRVVGYDYARRKTVLEWKEIERVDLTDHNLMLLATTGHCLEVPHLFPDFATLSHRIVEYAELHNVPIHVDGQPWQSLDIYAVFPFIEDDAATHS